VNTEPTWELLICTIPHRHGTLLELLADLDRQITNARVSAILYRDNLSVTYGNKTQALLDAATADYVSCVDDDDLILPGGVDRVLAALDQRPDYVGFAVKWTQNGQVMFPVEHSLRHPRWENGETLLRSVMHFNPIRTDIARDGRWEGGNGAEKAWGDQVILRDRCKSEVYIPEPVYWYRENTHDTFNINRERIPEYQIQPIPPYPWLYTLATEHSV
jgi:hypothetical protein